jgi:hypothetical protein
VSEDQGELWVAAPRVPPSRYVKPADQERAEAALGDILDLIETRMLGTPLAATADVKTPIENQFVLCGLVRCVALAAAIRVLAAAREDEGVPIVNRSLVDAFLSTAYCVYGGFDAIQAVIRDSAYRENLLRGRYTDVEALEWDPKTIDPRLNPEPPDSTDKLDTWKFADRLAKFDAVQADSDLEDAVSIAYNTFFRWDSTLSVHATLRSVTGHMFRAKAERAYPVEVGETPAGVPLTDDVLVFTGSNGNVGDITSRLWFARRALWYVAFWVASVWDPSVLPALRALIDPAQGGAPLSTEGSTAEPA